MSIPAAPELPGLLHVHRHADNHTAEGDRFYPDSQFFTHAVATKAHCVAFARKLLFSKHYGLGEPGFVGGSVTARWHCKTGPACDNLLVFVVLGIDDRNLAAEPNIEVAITRVSAATTTTKVFSGGESTVVATDAPDEFITSLQVVAAVPSEVYTGTVTHNNNVRLISILAYEASTPTVDDANPPHQEWQPSAGSPVMDDDVAGLLDGVGDMLRGMGGLRFDWSTQDGTARTRTSATWINLIDNASASPPTASSPGITLNTNYRNTISATTVPVTFAVYGSITGGATGTATLRNTAGTDVATVTINSGTAQWFTATGNLAVGSAVKYDVGFASDGAATLTVNAVSLYEEG